MSTRLACTLTPDHQEMTLGQVLKQELGLSSSVIRRIKWLEDGILLDGQRVTTRTRGQAGQTLSALIGEATTTQVLPVPGDLDIRYEDDHLLVVNKPAGIPCHPSYGHAVDTLGNFLLYHYQTQGKAGGLHLVHRLDKGTSGLMVVAKHPHAQQRLSRQLHSPAFCRKYWAVTEGWLTQEAGTICQPIAQIAGGQRREIAPHGQQATTHYQVIARWQEGNQPCSLVELTLETGRTHQIRVHLAHLGHPLVGDGLYGGGDGLPRPALHARHLTFTHPVTGEALTFTQAPPPDMAGLLPQNLPVGP